MNPKLLTANHLNDIAERLSEESDKALAAAQTAFKAQEYQEAIKHGEYCRGLSYAATLCAQTARELCEDITAESAS